MPQAFQLMLHAVITPMPGCAFCLCMGEEGAAVPELELHVPAGPLVGLAGQSHVRPAQLSAFPGPSSSANCSKQLQPSSSATCK